MVCTQLDRAGTTAVLSGGGAATIYAPEVYQSRDLDFILGFWSSLGASAAPLFELGFELTGSTYCHPATLFTVEFPKGPLSIGEEEVTAWHTLRRLDDVDGGEMILHILSPTDCVRDRLAWFIYDNDFSGLIQAVGVAFHQQVDMEAIESWCKKEKAAMKFAIFRENLSKAQTDPNGR